MQSIDMSGFRRNFIEKVEDYLTGAAADIQNASEDYVKLQGGETEGIPSLDVHQATIRIEEILDVALQKHSCDAEDSFLATSITGKSESITIKDGAKMVIKVDDDVSIGDIANIHKSKWVCVISQQGTLFADEAEAEQPQDIEGQMQLDDQPGQAPEETPTEASEETPAETAAA